MINAQEMAKRRESIKQKWSDEERETRRSLGLFKQMRLTQRLHLAMSAADSAKEETHISQAC